MPLRIAITGSTGMVGKAICAYFQEQGCEISPLLRPSTKGAPSSEKSIPWDSQKGWIDLPQLEGCDVLIHLAGANISARRWTPKYKKLIYDSRVESTKLLQKSILNLKNPPKVWFCASAVGIYGHHSPQEILDESSPLGQDFLAQVCRDWEAASVLNRDDIRVINLRFGMILEKSGGALAKMLPVFRLGLGGPIGNGCQMISWVALKEIPLIVEHIINNEKLSGPINVVSPEAVSNREFTKVLGGVLKRPAVLPVPALAIKLIFSEMGKSLLLNGAKVFPQRLMDSGYFFKYSNIQFALEKIVS
ncbi:MAG: TIGR01777 family oxidoreductase [Candidatus Omnitrophica bacterium]|nr:TIGR01777 family oxidoreductase [Candidatus Omnitrophota bacterium]